MNLLEIMIRWREYGKQSWNYPDADFDLYLLTEWTSRIKDSVVEAVRENKDKHTSYIEAAIIGEIYQLILLGQYGEKNLKNFTTDNLFVFKDKTVKNSSHSREWISLCNLLTQKDADANNRRTVRRYFNLPQGDGGTKIVLDEPHLIEVFRKIKANKLVIPPEDLNSSDPSSQRQAPYRFLKDILDRLENVIRAELNEARPLMEMIKKAFQLGDEEQLDKDILTDFAADVTRFYTEINDNQISIPFNSASEVKKYAERIAKHYNDINRVLDSDDQLSTLMAFSGDPIASLKILTTLLERLDTGLNSADSIITERLEQFNGMNSGDKATNPYEEALNEIKESRALWEGETDDEQ